MSEAKTDALTPGEVAVKVRDGWAAKCRMDLVSMFTLALPGGGFIALAAVFFTLVVHDSTLSVGLTKLIGGLVFCLGLVLVVVSGAELFTGNSLLCVSLLGRTVGIGGLLRNWVPVFIGNFVGSLGIVLLMHLSGLWLVRDAAVGVSALQIACSKVQLPFVQAFSRAILCNMLVCLAVWMCLAGRSVADKVLVILLPISAFVALGFEHSVANMYFIPAGLVLKHSPQVLAALPATVDAGVLSWRSFLLGNLVPVTLGNVIGGGVMVGGMYWVAYLRNGGPNASPRA